MTLFSSCTHIFASKLMPFHLHPPPLSMSHFGNLWHTLSSGSGSRIIHFGLGEFFFAAWVVNRGWVGTQARTQKCGEAPPLFSMTDGPFNDKGGVCVHFFWTPDQTAMIVVTWQGIFFLIPPQFLLYNLPHEVGSSCQVARPPPPSPKLALRPVLFKWPVLSNFRGGRRHQIYPSLFSTSFPVHCVLDRLLESSLRKTS
jgi:hypothetical protein